VVDADGLDRVFDVQADAHATIVDTHVTGGLIWGVGGGIRVLGALDMQRSTVFDNAAVYWGGGVYFNDGSAGGTIHSSTISGNTAQNGGGLQAEEAVTVSWTTITDNEAWTTTSPVGGVRAHASNQVTLRGVIIADQTTSDANCSGATVSLGDNLSSDASCAAISGDITNDSADLGALADNGGYTLTHLPQTGSPAINNGPGPFLGCPQRDQRGILRDDNLCDSGSVEV
jgi:hypothetical protein